MSAPMELAQAALGYAELGWPVLPLRPGQKEPLIRGGHGCLDATTNPARIEAWWRREPDANIGLACGDAFWVLDADCGGWDIESPDGADSLVYLTESFGKLPRTVRQYTGGMGWQWLWAPDARVRNGVKVLPGLDTRSTAGYVVAPPSLHPSGRHYHWIEGPGGVEIASAPPWLLTLLAPPPEPAQHYEPRSVGNLSRYATAALESACRTIERAVPGEQNATVNGQSFSIGQLVGGGVIPRSEARSALVAAGTRMSNQQGKRPWSHGEIARLVDRALASGASNPRSPETRP
jgi:hypothetical protein